MLPEAGISSQRTREQHIAMGSLSFTAKKIRHGVQRGVLVPWGAERKSTVDGQEGPLHLLTGKALQTDCRKEGEGIKREDRQRLNERQKERTPR